MRKNRIGLQGWKLKKHLQEQEGYSAVICVPYVGWCVLETMIDHTALKYTCDQWGCKGHYRFRERAAAAFALINWNGVGDPLGPWFEKHEAGIMIKNPTYPEYVNAGMEYIGHKLSSNGKQ